MSNEIAFSVKFFSNSSFHFKGNIAIRDRRKMGYMERGRKKMRNKH
jgi:hypothetical protein